jgi:redox-sensitive bicupin YhaK (pirin superfamily)
MLPAWHDCRMSDSQPEIQSLPARKTELGSLRILRALPRRQRRTVGAWCFLDRYGPLQFASGTPMDVAPHPHIGLQTVSWLLQGEIIHNDSLGSEALMRAGQLNLMTAGQGISHSEETPPVNSGALDGVQLWVALPGDRRGMAPAFNHYAALPVIDLPAGRVTLIAGTLMGETSPAQMFSPIVGAEIAIRTHEPLLLAARRDFEYAVFVLQGNVLLDKRPLEGSTLHYLGTNREELALSGSIDARVLLLGGEPFRDPLLMWWNFVGGSHEEISAAREDWIQQRRFGEVTAYRGPRLPAPDLARLAPPNPAS